MHTEFWSENLKGRIQLEERLLQKDNIKIGRVKFTLQCKKCILTLRITISNYSLFLKNFPVCILKKLDMCCNLCMCRSPYIYKLCVPIIVNKN
jgi:hypothetical protein